MGCRRQDDCIQGHISRTLCPHYFKSCPRISSVRQLVSIIKPAYRTSLLGPSQSGAFYGFTMFSFSLVQSALLWWLYRMLCAKHLTLTLTFDPELWPRHLPSNQGNTYNITQRGADHLCMQKFLSGLAGLVYFYVYLPQAMGFCQMWLLGFVATIGFHKMSYYSLLF